MLSRCGSGSALVTYVSSLRGCTYDDPASGGRRRVRLLTVPGRSICDTLRAQRAEACRGAVNLDRCYRLGPSGTGGWYPGSGAMWGSDKGAGVRAARPVAMRRPGAAAWLVDGPSRSVAFPR
jgi:hypothetical protein